MDFPLVSLGELCEKITDGTHHSPQSFEFGAYKYITAKNIKPWGLDLTNLTYVDEKTHKEIYSRCDVKKNDILYIKDGATTGIATINPLQEEFSLLSSVGVLRPGPSILPKYLLYALQETATKERMMDGIAGVAITRLTLKKLNDAVIPWAPINYQARIVEKLEELLSDLDAGVAELKAAQRKLGQYRQSLLKAAVEGALTAQWRAQHTPTETGAQLLERIQTERRARWEARQLAKFEEQGKAAPKDWRKKYPEPVRPDISDLPEIPRGWTWATIDQLAQVGTGVTPLRAKSEYFDGGTFPWITSGALNSEVVATASELVTELAIKECRLEMYPPGTLLVAMYGEGKTRGKCAELRIPATTNQAIAAIRLETEALPCKAYVKAFLLDSYERMRSQASGGVQPNLNLQIIKSISIPLPAIEEQYQITAILDGQFTEIAGQFSAVKKALQQSAAQRKNILKTAFSGQLVPQDPGGEPAAVLLARIRAERAGHDTAKKPRGRKAKESS